MILFFHGEDTYRLQQKVKALKEKFISASLGDTNLAVIDGKTLTYEEFMRQILAMPFLSKTRLVIIENLFSQGSKTVQENIGEKLDKIPSSTILLLTEVKPDKRLGLYKKIIKTAKAQEFTPFDPVKLRLWLKLEIENRGGQIESDALDRLIEYVGNDLWRLSNEIEKLISYCQGTKISSDDIKLLVRPQTESNIFDLVDAVGEKNLKRALNECQKLLENGQNELYILSMIVYQYRNLLILKDLFEHSADRSQWALAKKAGLHPFVVGKALMQLKNFSLSDLKNSYNLLGDFDCAIKTGKMENRVALTLLITKLVNF